MASHTPRGTATFGTNFKVRWIESVVLALLANVLFFEGVRPGWLRLNTDFPNYYLVARLFREHYALQRIYDWFWLQRIKDHWGLDQVVVSFAGLTPFSALPILPLSFLSALLAKRLWIVANLVFLWSAFELLSRIVSIGRRRVWVVALMAVLPLVANLRFGQMHLLVLLLIVCAFYSERKHRHDLCGVFLALAGALKVYPFLFGAYFLWKKEWKNFWSLVGATIALLILGWVLFGPGVMSTYLTEGLPRSLVGEMLDPYNARAASGAALFHRLFIFEPELNPAPAFNSPLLYASLYPLWQLTILFPLFAAIQPSESQELAGRDRNKQLEWAAFVVALLTLSPVPSNYHFVVMIFSMVILADILVQRQKYRSLGIALFLYCAISITGLHPFAAMPERFLAIFLGFGRLWIGMLLTALFIFCLWEGRQRYAIAPRRVMLLTAICAAVWLGGFVSYQRHFAYLATDLSRRIQMPAKSYLATPPQSMPGGYLYVAMNGEGYRVLNQEGKPAFANRSAPRRDAKQWPATDDQLSAGVAARRSFAVGEVASVAGSRIERIPSAQSSDPLTAPIAEDGETPAVSFDGTAIAFLRESQGRGSLWLTHQTSAAESFVQPIQLVPDSYDVQDAAFDAAGHVYFTARNKDTTSIFRVDAAGAPAVFLLEQDAVRSPAFSPDGQYLAFARLHHRRWQIAVLDLTSHKERSLTEGDCNAYLPQWLSPTTVAYGTDCARGLGLTAVASVRVR